MTIKTRAAYLKAQERNLIDEIRGLADAEAFMARAGDLVERLARVQEALRKEGTTLAPWTMLDDQGDVLAEGTTEGQLWINAAGLKGRCFTGAEVLDFRRRMEARGYRAVQAKAA